MEKDSIHVAGGKTEADTSVHTDHKLDDLIKDVCNKSFVCGAFDWYADTKDNDGYQKLLDESNAAEDALRQCIDGLVRALQMAKHIVAAEGTTEQLNQVFAALEMAGIQP